MVVNLTGLQSAPSFENLSSWDGEPSLIQLLLAWTSVQTSIHPICCQRLEVMHILIRCCTSRQENASMLCCCFFFCQAVAAPNRESGEVGRRGCYLGQYGAGGALGVAALLTRWHYRGVDLLVRCSCHIMEPGKGKESTQTRGGGGSGDIGLTQAGPALELAGMRDGSSTCQLQEMGYLEQEFGQCMQGKYFRCQECSVYCDHCCGAAVDESRPIPTQMSNK